MFVEVANVQIHLTQRMRSMSQGTQGKSARRPLRYALRPIVKKLVSTSFFSNKTTSVAMK
jgi:hypothetical protein